jgi:hypothetical protein
MPRLLERLPLQFRVLYRQFLLRVVDLEDLSMHADLPRYLGQFAGVLIMLSLIQTGAALLSGSNAITPEARLIVAWHAEQWLLSTMMLIIGLAVVFMWDSTFPDRRDAMVLGPLPVTMGTILSAKVAASISILGGAIVAFNFASGVAWPLVIGGSVGFPRLFAAYWLTMFAASAFLYASVLTVQGLTALLLPRRFSLRLSSLFQILAFGLFLAVYFLQPVIDTPAALAAPQNQRMLAASPCFWFFALLNQLNGSLPPALAGVAHRAWIALSVAITGAATSLLLCYLSTLRRTIEEADLVPAARAFHGRLRVGSTLDTAILFFTFRSLTRSRQHRLAFAFYLAVVFALTILLLRPASPVASRRPMSVEFLCATFLMIGFSVVGLRKVFALPIWLAGNWVFRIAQSRPAREYMAATRRSLLVLGILPVWWIAALLSLRFRPLSQAAAHLAVLALFGIIVCDISLIGFQKLPFTCSYLPGKANVQFVFWGLVIVVLPLLVLGSLMEQQALHNPRQYLLMMIVLVAVAIGLRTFHRHRAESAILDFDEVPPEEITTLGLSSVRRSDVRTDMRGEHSDASTSAFHRN